MAKSANADKSTVDAANLEALNREIRAARAIAQRLKSADATLAGRGRAMGFGGGDTRVVKNWLHAIKRNDPGLILTSAQESLRTHTIVFAAEPPEISTAGPMAV